MMKKGFLVLIIVGVIAGVVIYNDPQLSSRFAHIFRQTTDVSPTVTLYKWQDKNGQWQLTDVPPEGNTPFKAVKVNKDANVVPGKSERR